MQKVLWQDIDILRQPQPCRLTYNSADEPSSRHTRTLSMRSATSLRLHFAIVFPIISYPLLLLLLLAPLAFRNH
jgi:hypothetical protein